MSKPRRRTHGLFPPGGVRCRTLKKELRKSAGTGMDETMMKTSSSLLSLVTLMLLCSCGEDETYRNAAEAKDYPLETCIVADSKLGSMGKPHVIVHEGQTVKFCCDACLPDFEEDPAKFLAKLEKPAEPKEGNPEGGN